MRPLSLVLSLALCLLPSCSSGDPADEPGEASGGSTGEGEPAGDAAVAAASGGAAEDVEVGPESAVDWDLSEIDPDDDGLEEDRAAWSGAREAARSGPESFGGGGVPKALTDRNSGLEIYLFSIGQADSMLVIGPAPAHRTLLVDLGEDRSRPGSGAAVVQRIRELTGRNEVDYFVATHYHADHVGYRSDGIVEVLDDHGLDFSVGTFIDVGEDGAQYLKKSRGTFKKLERRMPSWLAKEVVGKRERPRIGVGQIDLGDGVSVEIVAAGGRTAEGGPSAMELVEARWPGLYAKAPASENDLSIAMEISTGDFELFTGGDLSGAENPRYWYTPREFSDGKRETYTNVERRLVERWAEVGRESDVEIYRANHHGSHHSTTSTLLDALDPEVVLYSVGAKYGHPSDEVVERSQATADQLATTEVSDAAHFSSHGGEVVGEIDIIVAPGGGSYTLEGQVLQSFEDGDEAADKDASGS